MKPHDIPRTIVGIARRLHHIIPLAICDFLHHTFCPESRRRWRASL